LPMASGLHTGRPIQGRIQDFKLGGALKKLHRAEGGAKNFGVFRVKNHDFTPKNYMFSNCGGRREIFGVFRAKNHDFTPKNHIFSNFRPGAPPPWIRPCNIPVTTSTKMNIASVTKSLTSVLAAVLISEAKNRNDTRYSV
jgi:hypothetical protein